MLTSEEIFNFIKENQAIIKQRFWVSEIGLFGSFARNEQNETSNIDI